MYVYMCVYVYTYVHIYTHMYMYTYAYLHVHIHTHTHCRLTACCLQQVSAASSTSPTSCRGGCPLPRCLTTTTGITKAIIGIFRKMICCQRSGCIHKGSNVQMTCMHSCRRPRQKGAASTTSPTGPYIHTLDAHASKSGRRNPLKAQVYAVLYMDRFGR